jgi:hypothetical protein
MEALGIVGIVAVFGLVVGLTKWMRRPRPSSAAVDERTAAEHARPYVHIEVSPHGDHDVP